MLAGGFAQEEWSDLEIYHPRDEELLREMRRVRRSNKRRRLLWGFVIWLALCLAAGAAVYFLYYDVTLVHGTAMGDTLPGGSLVLVRRNPPEGYRSGDLVLYNKEETQQVRRLLALGGDNVVISPYTQSELRVNGTYLEEPYTVGSPLDAGVSTRRLNVPEGEIFVAGDQRALSMDSRFRDYGTIPLSDVSGRVDIILWPLYRLGAVQDENLGSLLAPILNWFSSLAGRQSSTPAATAAPEAEATVAVDSDESEEEVQAEGISLMPSSPEPEFTAETTEAPTAEPTSESTAESITESSAELTAEPTAEPTEEVTEEPTAEPTATPTATPTTEPTEAPTEAPTKGPAQEPATELTEEPTAEAEAEPTATTKPGSAIIMTTITQREGSN